jgi:predicted HNH restriction endonuclease
MTELQKLLNGKQPSKSKILHHTGRWKDNAEWTLTLTSKRPLEGHEALVDYIRADYGDYIADTLNADGYNSFGFFDSYVPELIELGDHTTVASKGKYNSKTKTFLFDVRSSQTKNIAKQTLLKVKLYYDENGEPEISVTRREDGIKKCVDKREEYYFGEVPDEEENTATYPDEDVEGAMFEGATTKVEVNFYERNPKARQKCIEHYGAECQVCGCNLGEIYGEEFSDKIHVHHIKPLSECKGEYQVDPIKDLRPVCPNCHMIIHSRRGKPYTIEEVKRFIKKR